MGNTVWIIVGAVVVVLIGIWLFMSADGTGVEPAAPAAIDAPVVEEPATEPPVVD
ncbi:hypothetical protein [Marivita sp. GX14005]|uniref:hypothetical protein n=1 Tax=Marivita sp. GX14005 TaxID=2942276 RepID=UPI002019E91D|nr:hypothetical protein [Marivita sp. GX14005]MCL3882899.1 hypothetical protein [Marivita sp. GX14005]